MTYHVQECVGATAKRINLDTAFFREIVYQAPGADQPVVVAYIREEYADPVCAVLNISGVDPCHGIEPRVPTAMELGEPTEGPDETAHDKPCQAGTLTDDEDAWCTLPHGHDGSHISADGEEWDGVNGTTASE